MLSRAALLLTVSCLVSNASEPVWDRFRGPNGAGVSVDAGIPEEFGPQTNLAWKTPLPEGNSSPVFGADSIFLTGFEDDKLITLALDRSAGRIKWRREIVRQRAGRLREPNNPASPSVATDGTNAFAFFQDFGLVAYGADGNELWRMPLGPFNNPMGLGASPVFVEGKVILICDSETDSFMIAVDASTGEIAWRNERPYSLRGFSTPVVHQPDDGGLQVLVAGSYELAAYDVGSGEKVWWVEGLTWQLKPTPVLDGQGYAYVLGWAGSADLGQQEEVPPFQEVLAEFDADSDGRLSAAELSEAMGKKLRNGIGSYDLDNSGYMELRDWEHHRRKRRAVNAVRKIKLGGKGDMTEGAVQWLHYKSLPNVPSPLLYDGILYLTKDGGIMTALSAEDGGVLKQARLRDAMGRYFASPVAADGKIFAADETGQISVVRPGPEWEVIRTNVMGEGVYATPVIMDGRLFVRTSEALYCFAE
ncbi:MAG: PQQ-binding-like beta-propeller repeat protein [Bryobacterales bacterium]|nr:PQQ-binding-like beta-propeller repeat protein [Bryobacterales bacterium]